jgi:hypothetical protein
MINTVQILKGDDFMMINKISLILVIIGALNWLLIGVFGYDIVGAIFGGQMALFSRIVYTLVGLAGIWCITLLFNRTTASNS